MKKYILLLSFCLAVADVQCAEEGAIPAAAAAASSSRQSSGSRLKCKVATEEERASSGVRIDLEAESFVFNKLGVLRFIEDPKSGGCFFVVFDTEEEACKKKEFIFEIYRKKMPLIIDQLVQKKPFIGRLFPLIVKNRKQYFSESQIDAMAKDKLSVHDLTFLNKKNELRRMIARQEFAIMQDPNGSRFEITEEFMDAQAQKFREEFDLQKTAISRLLAAALAAPEEAKPKKKAPKKSVPAVAQESRKTASRQKKEEKDQRLIDTIREKTSCSLDVATFMVKTGFNLRNVTQTELKAAVKKAEIAVRKAEAEASKAATYADLD